MISREALREGKFNSHLRRNRNSLLGLWSLKILITLLSKKRSKLVISNAISYFR